MKSQKSIKKAGKFKIYHVDIHIPGAKLTYDMKARSQLEAENIVFTWFIKCVELLPSHKSLSTAEKLLN